MFRKTWFYDWLNYFLLSKHLKGWTKPPTTLSYDYTTPQGCNSLKRIALHPFTLVCFAPAADYKQWCDYMQSTRCSISKHKRGKVNGHDLSILTIPIQCPSSQLLSAIVKKGKSKFKDIRIMVHLVQIFVPWESKVMCHSNSKCFFRKRSFTLSQEGNSRGRP